MKKFILLIFVFLSTSLCRAQLTIPGTENYILNQDAQQVLDTQGINDPIRDGAYNTISANGNTGNSELGGIIGVDAPISNFQSAQNQTLQIVKNILNYILGLLALVALIYLIFNGFTILTATGDETRYKKGLQSIKYAVIAIAGIGASRLIVSFIFWLLDVII